MPDHQKSDKNPDQTDIFNDIRTQLRELLPRAIRCAIASYQQFSHQITPDDPKQFIAYHNACRAALVHVDTLSKLTRWLVTQHPQPSDQHDLQPLLQQARRVMLDLGMTDTEDQPEDHDESGASEF